MQNFGRENFDDSTCIRQNSSDFSTIKVLRYTVLAVAFDPPTHMIQTLDKHMIIMVIMINYKIIVESLT